MIPNLAACVIILVLYIIILNFDSVIGDLVVALSELLFINKILCVTYVHTCWYSVLCFCLCYVLTTARIPHSLMVKCHGIFQLSGHGKRGVTKRG